MGRRTQAPPISWLMKLPLDHPSLISLAAGFTDNKSLPVAEARALLNEILGSGKTGRMALQYGTTVGDAPLRRLTAERLWQLDSSGGTRSAASKDPDDRELVPPAAANDRGYSLGGSRFLKVCFGKKVGPVPQLDIELERAVQNAVRDLIRLDLVTSAHDCSEGGLAVALAECCFSPDRLFGAEINFENCGCARDTPASTDATTLLFNEAQSRVIISCEPKNTERVLSELKSKNIPHAQIGSVITESLRVTVNGENLSWRVAELHDLWWNSIRRAVESDSEPIPSL